MGRRITIESLESSSVNMVAMAIKKRMTVLIVCGSDQFNLVHDQMPNDVMVCCGLEKPFAHPIPSIVFWTIDCDYTSDVILIFDRWSSCHADIFVHFDKKQCEFIRAMATIEDVSDRLWDFLGPDNG